MNDIWSFLLQTLTASGVAVLLLVLKAVFRDKLSPRWQFAAWGVLATILLLPAGRSGRYTLMNWPFIVELCRSAYTGEYGALAHVAAPIPFPPVTVPQTAAGWLFILYLAGVVFFLVRYLVAYVRLRRVLGRGRPVGDGRVQAVAEIYGLPVCPVVEVDGLPSAFVCGVFRPVLALPAGIETDEKVLLHELLHLSYKDAAWGILICLFRCVHWCNPLLWYCADQAGNDLESLCDQRVLERLEGEDRRDYGRILLEMADEKYARAPGTSSMANGGKNICRRIEAIARFKRYPAGMALVSVCVLLVLTLPLTIGTQAGVEQNPLERVHTAASELSYARTVPCTTCAGAFDTYAKSVLRHNIVYRAMCTPLSEQNDLARLYEEKGAWGWWEGLLPDYELDRDSGYEIYNLTQVEQDIYEGLLVVKLSWPPNDYEAWEWDGTVHSRWLGVQTVRAEKEGKRWVVIPQGEFRAVQGDVRESGNENLPFLTYEGQWGDFIVREQWQTAAQVNSYVQTNNWFGSYAAFDSTPQPGGAFTSWFYQHIIVVCTGSPAQDQTVGVSCMPWEGEARPTLRNPGPVGSCGSSSTGEDWGSTAQVREGEMFFGGGGGSRAGIVSPPDRYAADLYLNGEKAAELTLLPVEGGIDFDGP